MHCVCFLTSVLKQNLILGHLKIPDCFKRHGEWVKNIFPGHNNTLPINLKKLMRLERCSCDCAECFAGSLTWEASENPHMNQLIIDGFCEQDEGFSLKDNNKYSSLLYLYCTL